MPIRVWCLCISIISQPATLTLQHAVDDGIRSGEAAAKHPLLDKAKTVEERYRPPVRALSGCGNPGAIELLKRVREERLKHRAGGQPPRAFRRDGHLNADRRHEMVVDDAPDKFIVLDDSDCRAWPEIGNV